MKKILIGWLCMCAFAAASAQTNTAEQATVHETIRFGYLSYNDVLHAMPGYEQAERQVGELRAAYQKELTRSEEQFSKAYAEYVEGQHSFPENILLKRQKELQQLMDQAQQFKQEARQLLEENEKAVMQPLQERLDKAIHEVGMKHNLAFVVNTDNRAYPFINAGIGTDVTFDVLNLLK